MNGPDAVKDMPIVRRWIPPHAAPHLNEWTGTREISILLIWPVVDTFSAGSL
jgi:hypothetical protein